MRSAPLLFCVLAIVACEREKPVEVSPVAPLAKTETLAPEPVKRGETLAADAGTAREGWLTAKVGDFVTVCCDASRFWGVETGPEGLNPPRAVTMHSRREVTLQVLEADEQTVTIGLIISSNDDLPPRIIQVIRGGPQPDRRIRLRFPVKRAAEGDVPLLPEGSVGRPVSMYVQNKAQRMLCFDEHNASVTSTTCVAREPPRMYLTQGLFVRNHEDVGGEHKRTSGCVVNALGNRDAPAVEWTSTELAVAAGIVTTTSADGGTGRQLTLLDYALGLSDWPNKETR